MLIGFVGNVMFFFILCYKLMVCYLINVFFVVLLIVDFIVLFVGLFGLWISEVVDVDF